MMFSLDRFKNLSRAMALTGSLVALSACSGSFETDVFGMFRSKTPWPCPQVEVLPGADTITLYREGQGRDLVDVRYEGVITPVGGECVYVDDDSAIVANLILRIDATKGPAATGQSEDFPFFVAIARRDGRILAKEIFHSPVEFPDGRRRGAVQEEIEQEIPLTGITTGYDYVILVGFQLTKEQMGLED